MTVTDLRKNIFKIFDEVEKTGKPIEVSRKGQKFLIQPISPKKRKINDLDDWTPKNSIIGDPDDIVEMTPWHEKEWRELEIIDESLKKKK